MVEELLNEVWLFGDQCSYPGCKKPFVIGMQMGNENLKAY